MNKKAFALIFVFVSIAFLTLLSSVVLWRSVTESGMAVRQLETTQAFWLAEAGIQWAINGLTTNYALTKINNTPFGAGGFYADIAQNADGSRTITSHGFVPFAVPFRAERILTTKVCRTFPADFYENAIYSAQDIDISGSAYSVDGKVRYAGDLPNSTNITGTKTQDSTISPLALLDFAQLKAISIAQGNYHDSGHLGGPFPASFWYDEALGIPNVVFLEGNMVVKGNENVGGFYVVGGSVEYDATLNGNVNVEGCIYTRGNLVVNGGGNKLNINGGLWTGKNTMLHGGVDIDYNTAYMNAIRNMNVNTSIQLISWSDTQNPYTLVP